MNLRQYLFENRITQTDFARSIGCSSEYISLISNGKCIPGLHLAREIQRTTHNAVTVDDLRGERNQHLKKDEDTDDVFKEKNDTSRADKLNKLFNLEE